MPFCVQLYIYIDYYIDYNRENVFFKIIKKSYQQSSLLLFYYK